MLLTLCRFLPRFILWFAPFNSPFDDVSNIFKWAIIYLYTIIAVAFTILLPTFIGRELRRVRLKNESFGGGKIIKIKAIVHRKVRNSPKHSIMMHECGQMTLKHRQIGQIILPHEKLLLRLCHEFSIHFFSADELH